MPISYFSQHICSYEEAFEAILPNLKQYQHFVQDASEKEVDGIIKSTKHMNSLFQADLIVFPEDGLTGFEFSTAETLMPFTQHVPDGYKGWNPCLDPG